MVPMGSSIASVIVAARNQGPLRTAAVVLYVGGVIMAGTALLVALTPREYPNLTLALGLLTTTLALTFFKLRLPLANGVATLTPTCAVELVALVISGTNFAMVVAAVGAAF